MSGIACEEREYELRESILVWKVIQERSDK